MWLQKEEKIALVLLSMALLSIGVAFWGFSSPSEDNKIADSDRDSVVLEGRVTDVQATKTGGHVIIALNTSPIKIFVSRDAGANVVMSKIAKGDTIKAYGTVQNYQGTDELVVESSDRISKLS